MFKIIGGKTETDMLTSTGTDMLKSAETDMLKSAETEKQISIVMESFNLTDKYKKFKDDKEESEYKEYDFTIGLIVNIINNTSDIIEYDNFIQSNTKELFVILFISSSIILIDIIEQLSKKDIIEHKGGATSSKISDISGFEAMIQLDALFRLPSVKSSTDKTLEDLKQIFTNDYFAEIVKQTHSDEFIDRYDTEYVHTFCKEYFNKLLTYDTEENQQKQQKYESKINEYEQKLSTSDDAETASHAINKLMRFKFDTLDQDLSILNTDIYYKILYIYYYSFKELLNIFPYPITKTDSIEILFDDDDNTIYYKQKYILSMMNYFMIPSPQSYLTILSNNSDDIDNLTKNTALFLKIAKDNRVSIQKFVDQIDKIIKQYTEKGEKGIFMYIYTLYQIITKLIFSTDLKILKDANKILIIFDFWIKIKLKLILYFKNLSYFNIDTVKSQINKAFKETFNKQKKLYFFLKLRHKISEYNPRYNYIMRENTLAFKYYQTTYPLIPLTNSSDKPLKQLVSENYCKYTNKHLIQSYQDKSDLYDKIDFIDHNESPIMVIKENDEFTLFKYKSKESPKSWDELISSTHNMRRDQCKNNGELKEYIFSSYDKIMVGSDTVVTNRDTCIEFIENIDHDIGKKNICIIANGLSGSGKTSLLYKVKVTTSQQGGAISSDDPSKDGLLNCLLERLETKKLSPYDFKYKELYCGKILNNPTYNVSNSHGITSDEIIGKISEIFKQRKTSLTINNATSSRSHLIISIDIGQTPEGVEQTQEGVEQKRTTIHIIDLAGYENKIDYTNIIFLLSLGKKFTSSTLDNLYKEKLLYYMYTQESTDEINTNDYEGPSYSDEKVKKKRHNNRVAKRNEAIALLMLPRNEIIQEYKVQSIESSIGNDIKKEEAKLIAKCHRYNNIINMPLPRASRVTISNSDIYKLILYLIPDIIKYSQYKEEYKSVFSELPPSRLIENLSYKYASCVILHTVSIIKQLIKLLKEFEEQQNADETKKRQEHDKLNKLRTIAYVTHLEGDSIRMSLEQLYSGISTQFKNNIYRNDSACSDKHNSIQRLFDIIYSDIPNESEAPKNPKYLRTSIMHSISDTSEQKNNTTLAYINIVNISDEIKLNNPPIIPFIDLNNIFDMMLQLLKEYDINKKKELIKQILNNIMSIYEIISQSKYYDEYFDIDKIYELVANILDDVTESINRDTSSNKFENIYKDDKLSEWSNSFQTFKEPIDKFLQIKKQQNDMTLMGILSYPDKLLYSGEYYKTCSYTDIGKRTSNTEINTFFDNSHIQSQELKYDNIVKLLQSSLEFKPETRQGQQLPAPVESNHRPQFGPTLPLSGYPSSTAVRASSTGIVRPPSSSGYPSTRPPSPSAAARSAAGLPLVPPVRKSYEEIKKEMEKKLKILTDANRLSHQISIQAAKGHAIAPTTPLGRSLSSSSLRMRGGYNKYLKYKQKYINLKKKLSIYMTL